MVWIIVVWPIVIPIVLTTIAFIFVRASLVLTSARNLIGRIFMLVMMPIGPRSIRGYRGRLGRRSWPVRLFLSASSRLVMILSLMLPWGLSWLLIRAQRRIRLTHVALLRCVVSTLLFDPSSAINCSRRLACLLRIFHITQRSIFGLALAVSSLWKIASGQGFTRLDSRLLLLKVRRGATN
jgi:hypothetical protein